MDLVDLAKAPPVLKMQILEYGQLLACHDDRALAEFEMYTPRLYEDWKIRNRPREKKLRERWKS